MTFEQMINKVQLNQGTAITIGNFDGVHLGHQSLIDETVKQAAKRDLMSMVFTYSVRPLEYIYKKSSKTIDDSSFQEHILRERGIEKILRVPFGDTIMNMGSRQFVEDILIKKLRCQCLIMGQDSMLGKDREGKAAALQMMGRELGLGVYLVPLVRENGVRISSSFVRGLIQRGKMDEVKHYLGRPFSIGGKVVAGKQNGKRLLGIPTANLDIPENIVLPGSGVYYTRVKMGSKILTGATSIGKNPTFSSNNQLTLEVHLLDFDEDIYGNEIRVYFIKKLRDEMKFTSFSALKKQMEHDILRVRKSAVL